MRILRLVTDHIDTVYDIVQTTIAAVYPRYYPQGAVDFFAKLHSMQNICHDVSVHRVFLLLNEENIPVGTVTVKENEICRLFVLPAFQGKGYGSLLMKYAERFIAAKYSCVILDASLPAKSIYLHRGYVSIDYHTIETDNGDFLCYDIMQRNF